MDVFASTPPPADHRIAYGRAPQQFGDLRLPRLAPGQLAPVVMFLHGGWWQNAYDLTYAGHLCEALKPLGIASWSIEYRRVGDPGGPFPGTFQDAAAGFDFLSTLARQYPIDPRRIVLMGHSAGGHLAFWICGRHHIPAESPLHNPQPALAPIAVIGLAAAVDLRLTIDLSSMSSFSNGKPAVRSLIGGLPGSSAEIDARFRAANPGDLLPLNLPQVLLQGTEDDQIPPTLPTRYAANATRIGEHVTVTRIQLADHFDVVDPTSRAWPMVRTALQHVLG